jgi:hypothetical protein
MLAHMLGKAALDPFKSSRVELSWQVKNLEIISYLSIAINTEHKIKININTIWIM